MKFYKTRDFFFQNYSNCGIDPSYQESSILDVTSDNSELALEYLSDSIIMFNKTKEERIRELQLVLEKRKLDAMNSRIDFLE